MLVAADILRHTAEYTTAMYQMPGQCTDGPTLFWGNFHIVAAMACTQHVVEEKRACLTILLADMELKRLLVECDASILQVTGGLSASHTIVALHDCRQWGEGRHA